MSWTCKSTLYIVVLVVLQECPYPPGSNPISPGSALVDSAAWLLGPAGGQRCCLGVPLRVKPRLSLNLGVPKALGTFPWEWWVVFEGLWSWHSIMVWPINISYFCPSHITSPRHLKCWQSTQDILNDVSVVRGLLPPSLFSSLGSATWQDTDTPCVWIDAKCEV